MNRFVVSFLVLSQIPLCVSRAGEEITIHPKIKLQDFRSPGRVVFLRDGRFVCVSKGRYLVSTDKGRSWGSRTEIPAGPGPRIDGGMLVEDANGRVVL